MLTWIFFFFVAFGAKALLAFAMIYLIFPADRVCSECDGDTLPIRMGPLGRALSFLSRGAVQRRWCPRCGWAKPRSWRGAKKPRSAPAHG